MELPRDSSDLQIALACQICSGNGGMGNRRGFVEIGKTVSAKFAPCDSCNGTGWTLVKPKDLSATQLARLTAKLTATP